MSVDQELRSAAPEVRVEPQVGIRARFEMPMQEVGGSFMQLSKILKEAVG